MVYGIKVKNYYLSRTYAVNRAEFSLYQHENGNVLNRTSMDIALFNTNYIDEI